MTVGERIKRRRKELNITAEELGALIGKDRSTIFRYEKGDIEKLPVDVLIPIANALKTTPAYLMGWEEPDPTIPDNFRPLSVKRFPLLGNVACGEPIFAEELHEVYVDEDDNIHADFCLTAQGDSMINARIFEGDILFIRSQPTVENGEIAVVLIDDSATVKRIYFDRENKILTLVPENPLYKPTRFQGAELDRVRILGKVLSGKYDIE